MLVPVKKPSSVWRTLILFFAAVLTLGVFAPAIASAHSRAFVSVHNATVTEGDSTTAVNVRITLNHRVHHNVSVGWATKDGSAKAGSDYVAAHSRAFIGAGHRVAFAHIHILGDKVVEPDEFFKVVLFHAHGARIADGVGFVEIIDNDQPNLAINDTTVQEGNHAVLTVTLSEKSDKTVTVDFFTHHGTAFAFHDYRPEHGTLTFAPGDLTKTIAVETLTDGQAESAETFFVVLDDPVNATINPFHAKGTVTISANTT
jgi:hypothetical protein